MFDYGRKWLSAAFLSVLVMSSMSVEGKDVSVGASIDQVYVSNWGFDENDSTRFFQAAIDSGAKRVIVDRQRSEWRICPIKLRSSQEIVFAEGVVVRAKPGEFRDRSDCLFLGENVHDVALRGEGTAVLRMNKSDYADQSRYLKSEWRHVITLRKSSNIRISGLSLESSGGDGIYIDKSRNVVVEDCVSKDNRRQGMSVIGVAGLTVRRCRFLDTSGGPPQAGIDFEPNEPSESISDVLVENCEFAGNAGSGFDCNFSRFTSESHPVSITVRDCRMTGNKLHGIFFSSSQGTPVKGRIVMERCHVSGNSKSALRVVNQVAGRLEFVFKDCTFDGRNGEMPPFHFLNKGMFATFGSMKFDGCRLMCDSGQNAIVYEAPRENGMCDMHGTIIVERGQVKESLSLESYAAQFPPDPVLKSFGSRKLELNNARPVNPSVKGSPKKDSFVWFRDAFSFVQYVPKAGEYPLSIRLLAVGKNSLQALVEVFDPSGVRIDRFRARGDSTAYVIRANGAGSYVFRLNSFGHAISVVSPWPGQGVLADVPVPLIGGRRNAAPYRFSFYVPEGCENVAVQIVPSALSETAQARLIAPDGSVASCGRLRGDSHILQAKTASAKGVWTLDFSVVTEDCRFAIASPAFPVAAYEEGMALEYNKE